MRAGLESDALENILFSHALVCSNCGKNRIQRSDAQGRMRRNSNSMRSWLLRLQMTWLLA